MKKVLIAMFLALVLLLVSGCLDSESDNDDRDPRPDGDDQQDGDTQEDGDEESAEEPDNAPNCPTGFEYDEDQQRCLPKTDDSPDGDEADGDEPLEVDEDLCEPGLQCVTWPDNGYRSCFEDGEAPADARENCHDDPSVCLGNTVCMYMDEDESKSACLENCGECSSSLKCMDVTGDGYMGCLDDGYVPSNADSQCHEGDGCEGNQTCFFLNSERTESACIANCSPCYPGSCPEGQFCDNGMCLDKAPECSAEYPMGDCPDGKVCEDSECMDFICNDNKLEPNNSQDDAVDLPTGDTYGFQICSGDEDWYALTPAKDDTLYMIGLDSNNRAGNLVFDLLDDAGNIHNDSSITRDAYHEENAVGPTNLEFHGIMGSADALPRWFRVKGANAAIENNYGLILREVDYQDGPSCLDLYSQSECWAAKSNGAHDSDKLLQFPVSWPDDPYIGQGVFFENGLSAFGGPLYTETATMWARRELIMIVRNAIHAVQQAYPGTAPIGIGDISLPDGNTPAGHPNGTHYYGANIDIAYYIKPEYQGDLGNLAYRQICCDAPLSDWSCVDTDRSSAEYGTCVTGSESTHIVDIPRMALFLARIAGSGRLRVVGVEAKIEAEIDEELDKLVEDELITSAEKTALSRSMATANDHGSWIWHFNHVHASFLVGEFEKKAGGSRLQGPWPDLDLNLQADLARDFHLSNTRTLTHHAMPKQKLQ